MSSAAHMHELWFERGSDGLVSSLSMGSDQAPLLERTLLSKGKVDAPTESSQGQSKPAADVNDPLVGKRLKHFEVIRRLGEGGMGSVYLANDTSLERQVALKVLSSRIAGDSEIVARFVREARLQARLRHPNVAQIYFIGEDDGIQFFVMEYLPGMSLEDALEENKCLPWEEALEHTIAAARGLRAAAALGFIHRDVKPSNLMLDGDSGLKLVDFGLVKSMEGDVKLSQAGTILGSPLYMSPEQGQGRDADLRSDIYSLGCSLYHMVTGQPPFDADSAMGVIAKHLTEYQTAVRELVPVVPEALERLIDRMMEKSPEDRFSNYDELIEAAIRAKPDQRDLLVFRRRALALAIDLIPFAALALVHPALVLTAFLYFPLCHRFFGRTFGKLCLGLEVTNQEGGQVSWVAAFLRFLVFAWGPLVCGALFAILYFIHKGLSHLRLHNLEGPLVLVGIIGVAYLAGFLLAVFHPKRLAIHDIAARTWVRYRADPRAARVARMLRSTGGKSRSGHSKTESSTTRS